MRPIPSGRYQAAGSQKSCDGTHPTTVDSRSTTMTHPIAPVLILIDDDAAFRRTLKRAMERRGFAVHEFSSGAGALAAIDRLKPNMAVFEMCLANGSGLELTERLRAVCPEARILILTGYGSVETAVTAAKLGVTDYLAKPANATVIEAVLSDRPRQQLAAHTFLRPEEQEFNYCPDSEIPSHLRSRLTAQPACADNIARSRPGCHRPF